MVSIGVFAGCGGDDGGNSDSGGTTGGSGAAVEVDPTSTLTVEQFTSGFADETGFELTSESFPGGARTLSFDEDGDAMTLTEAETGFFEEFGAPQIYLVEADGDPDLVFDAVVGEPGKGEPIESGGDTVRLDREVSEEPDADGIVWSEQCVTYEKDKSLNTCAWSGTKRYGTNVIVSWTSTSDALDETASRLDQAVSATVAGASS